MLKICGDIPDIEIRETVSKISGTIFGIHCIPAEEDFTTY